MRLFLSRISYREWFALFLVILFLASMIAFFVQGANARKGVEARSAVSNCQQIEIVKDEIRATVSESVKRLPEIEYYKSHPDELKKAITDSEKSVARFKAIDCYKLPVVLDSNLKRPKKK